MAEMQTATEFDPITLEVVRNRVDVIAQEMQVAMVRSSFSVVIKEGWDCACSLFDPEAQTIAQAKSLPVHLGVLVSCVRRVIEDYPVETMREGDVYIFNDPYEGGNHIPDLTVVMPIIWEGRTVALACVMAHQQDFGGMAIGSLPPDATEIFQEGLILPPCKLVSEGEWNKEILQIILKNIRMPHLTQGDMRGMMAAGEVGKRRIQEMCAELGAETLQRYIEELMNRAERQTRLKIEEIPDGVYSFHDWLDNDGIDLEKRHKIQVTVTVKGSDIVFDFEGTDPQLKGAANSALSGPACCVYYAIRCITGADIPTNAGCFRPITLKVPKGSLLNPNHPAALNARTMTLYRTLDCIFGSLMQAIPGKLRASSGGMQGVSLSGRRAGSGGAYVYLELFAGGMGARPTKDGVDYIECDVTNMMNSPVEAVEMEYPLHISRARLWDDSGGPGKFRGGMGMEKAFEVLEGECEVTHRGDRHFTHPWGLFGGKPGASYATYVKRKDGTDFKVPSRLRFPLRPGDKMECYVGAGGGNGDPLEREPEKVREDVLDRKVSEKTAREEYGVVFAPGTYELNMEETETLRAEMREARGEINWTYDWGGDVGRK